MQHKNSIYKIKVPTIEVINLHEMHELQ